MSPNVKYQHPYQQNTVYSHVVELIRQYGQTSGTHLDLGCGYGAIAEPLRELGLDYVGLDSNEAAINDLRARGFKAGLLDLNASQPTLSKLREQISNPTLVSISLIDVLEHLTTGPALLEQLRALADGISVLLIISVPNIGHRDLAFKLLGGRWDYTQEGLLDHAHVIHHTSRLIDAVARRAGWVEVARNDFHMERSDQNFPFAHPLLSEHTAIYQYLRQLRDTVDPFASVNQLVRAYLPGPRKDRSIVSERTEDKARPFLSIVTRTQGKRLGALRDLLLCLTAQTCQDFECLIVAHKVDSQGFYKIRRIIEDTPAQMRSKCQLILCDRGNRTAPLNLGFEKASGHYISILDDDELVFAHWVETFKSLGQKTSGCVLRVVIAEQDIEASDARSDSVLGFRTVSAIRTPYPSHYDFFAHLRQNYSPTLSLAFPRTAFHELGIQFDETLNTTEDWDFEMRTVLVCGVQSSPEITGIYRKWRVGESSYALHSQDDWMRNYERIVSKLDTQYHIFPPGTIGKLNQQSQELQNQHQWILKLEADLAAIQQGGMLRLILRRFPRMYAILRRVYRACRHIVPGTMRRAAS